MVNSILQMDYKAIVSCANLVYKNPVKNPIEGQPIGNGTMGTMVWTTASTVEFQINRVDVFAVNKNHDGQFMSSPADYCGGCAHITVDVGGSPFTEGEAFSQCLDLYEAEDIIDGESVSVRCFISAIKDLMVVEVDDRRDCPEPLRVTVSMWRQPRVETGGHIACYEFDCTEGTTLVVQTFKEKEYYCTSLVTASIMDGRELLQKVNDKSYVIISPPKEGKRMVLISSAASWDSKADIKVEGIKLINCSRKQTYDMLRAEHAKWWEKFWSRTFVHLTSCDGEADFMERVRNMHLYYMACTSRGLLPPKWNGSIFGVDGDLRNWGTQFWIFTTETLYFPLYAADAIDLTDPFFKMYLSQLHDVKEAAIQRWGVKGIFYPETTSFDGPVLLPEDVACEYQDVILGRKETTEFTDRARRFGKFESHLHVISSNTLPIIATGRYTYISHIVSSGAEIALQAWWRYRYTGDKDWLRKNVYPLLQGTAEFYYNWSKKGEDNIYYIEGTNAHEDFWGVKNSIVDLAAIRGIVPLAIRAAEILEIDEDLRVKWQEFVDNLVPYPMGYEPESKALEGGVLSDDAWSAGHLGDVNGSHNLGDVWLFPIFPFEDWTLETCDPLMDAIAQKTMDLAARLKSILNGDSCNGAIRSPIAASRAGRGEQLPDILKSYYKAFEPLENRMSLFEGPKAPSIEILGLISTALQEGLLQSVSSRPGKPEVINVFPAWPNRWDASYRLLARGGFMVTTSIKKGKIEFIEIESRNGEECQIRNPWKKSCLLIDDDGKSQKMDGDILCFSSEKFRSYVLTPMEKMGESRGH
ncbi:MAG: DUF5703 domain-containing protein [Clostridiales bacterium]|nr:DUF5703 domain-containing protein [Clostridiales bacterium]